MNSFNTQLFAKISEMQSLTKEGVSITQQGFASLTKQFEMIRNDNITRLARVENEIAHIDKSVEIALTNALRKYFEDYATRHNMRFTFKMGQNFIKKLVRPNSNDVITDLDGCFILSNNQRNTQYSNTQNTRAKRSEMIKHLESELLEKQNLIGKLNAQKADKMKCKIDAIQQKLVMFRSAETQVQKEQKQFMQSKIDEKQRFICIVEAKVYVSNDEVEKQQNKMANLIDYFAAVNLYHVAKSNNDDLNIDSTSTLNKWSQNFIATNEQLNLRFNGIIILIGGPNILEEYINLAVEQTNMTISAYIDDRKRNLDDRIAKLSDNNDDKISNYITKELQAELDWLNSLTCEVKFAVPNDGMYTVIDKDMC